LSTDLRLHGTVKKMRMVFDNAVCFFIMAPMSQNLRTSLYDEHVSLKARMAPFGGWEMPILYRGIIQEHVHTRERVSVFDICHMGEFELTGRTAEADLEKLLTQSVVKIPEGGCGYGYLLNENGGVLDDLICYRFADEKFWLVVNASTAQNDSLWIKSHLSSATQFRDISNDTAKLDIQGPRARMEIEKALGIKLPDLEYYHFTPFAFDGIDCVLSRTGYTGEFGYELYLPVQHAVSVWRRLLAPGAILPAGLGARDTLRVEMGFPLYGHELSEKNTPAGAARGKFIDLSKDFIGCDPVRRAMQDESTRRLVGLQLEGRMAARPDDSVFDGEREVGKVTSGLFSPSLNVAVALAYVERACSDAGRKLAVISREKKLPVEIVKLPFYKKGTARQN